MDPTRVNNIMFTCECGKSYTTKRSLIRHRSFNCQEANVTEADNIDLQDVFIKLEASGPYGPCISSPCGGLAHPCTPRGHSGPFFL